MRSCAPARLAAATGIVALGCILEPPAGIAYDDEDDGSVLDEVDEPSHRSELRSCETQDGEARLHCVRAANDALAGAVLEETGSEAIVLPPLAQHREFGTDLCGWLADPERPSAACEAELELALGALMDIYLEHEPYSLPPRAEFDGCRAAFEEDLRRPVNDLARTLAAADFAQCVEEVIAAAAPTLGDPQGVRRADDPRLELLTEGAPGVADAICILLTARDGEHLPADRVLQCQAQWQIEMFTVALAHA
jgi:hypothetical protein